MKKLKRLTLRELSTSAVVMGSVDEQKLLLGGTRPTGWDSLLNQGGGFEDYMTDWGAYGNNSIPVYQTYADAQCLSEETGKECGGLVFADGNTIIYQSDKSSCTSNVPLLPTNYYCVDGEDVSVWNGEVILSNFHTHPNLPYASEADKNVQSTYYPNCDMTILQNNNVTTYNYEGGFLVP